MRLPLFMFLAILLLACALAPSAAAPAAPPPAATRPGPKLRTFTTPYYVMYTDLNDDGAREAWIRMTKMFEVYKRRTAGFSGDIKERFPFYLYTNEADYLAAGGPVGSGGVFMYGGGAGAKLMAIAGDKPDAYSWHTIQHEAFHQFAYAVIGGEMPPWLNEGMAEYFGEAIFTGDDFVTGIIPPRRLKEVQKQIADKGFLPIKGMMQLSSKDWIAAMEGANYDQAWSMVHFLAHAEDGKYQKPFIAYMRMIAAGKNADDAWKTIFGNDLAAFQKKWEAWWMAQKPSASLGLYQQEVLLTLTGYLGRAVSQGQTFATADAFIATAEKGELNFNREDWLPPALLQRALRDRVILGTLTLEPPSAANGHTLRLLTTPEQGDALIGTFTLNGNRIRTVSTEISKTAAPSTTPATPGPIYERARD